MSVLRIARAECREHARDGRVLVGAVLLVTMGVVSIAFGWKHHAELSRAIAAAQVETQEQFRSQGKRNPHSGAHFGIHAFRPESALGFLERGVDDFVGITVFVEPHEPSYFRDPPAEDATALTRFGNWTFARTLQLLAPLLVILLAAPSIAGERERGTLRLLRSLGLTGRELVTGKALGILLTTLVAIVPAALLAWGGSLVLSSSLPSEPVDATRTVLFVGVHLGYLVVVLLVSMVISARARSTQSAVLVGLAFWAATSLAAPRIGTEVARRMFPTPSASELAGEIHHRTWYLDKSKWSKAEQDILAEQMRLAGVTRAADLPVNVAGLVLQRQEDEDAVVFDEVYDRLHARIAQQDGVLDGVSLFAPYLAAQTVSMAASESDSAHNAYFWRATETYRRELVAILNRYMTEHTGGNRGYSVLVDREAWSLVPAFSYRHPPADLAVQRCRPALAILAAWLALAALAAAAAGRRLDQEG